MSAATKQFARRIHELRKKMGWSQAELAGKISTSAAIIGRYERGEMTPSIEVAHKVARTFEVTLDYLLADGDVPNILQDSRMMERWRALDALPAEDRERILYVVDGLIRDAQARQAYARTG